MDNNSRVDTSAVRDYSVKLIGGLKATAGYYRQYSDEVARVEGLGAYTREYKDRKIAEAKDAFLARIHGVVDGMRATLDGMAAAINNCDNACDYITDPGFASCLALLQAADKPLPLETIGGMADYYKGHRQALTALAAVAKQGNKEIISGRIYEGVAAYKRLQEQMETMDMELPDSIYMVPELRRMIVEIADGYGETLTDAETDCGIDYQDIATLEMRRAMGL